MSMPVKFQHIAIALSALLCVMMTDASNAAGGRGGGGGGGGGTRTSVNHAGGGGSGGGANRSSSANAGANRSSNANANANRNVNNNSNVNRNTNVNNNTNVNVNVNNNINVDVDNGWDHNYHLVAHRRWRSARPRCSDCRGHRFSRLLGSASLRARCSHRQRRVVFAVRLDVVPAVLRGLVGAIHGRRPAAMNAGAGSAGGISVRQIRCDSVP